MFSYDLVNYCSICFEGFRYIGRKRFQELLENSISKNKEIGLKRFFCRGVTGLFLIGRRLGLADNKLD
jgi:hypothetical protein